MRRPTAVAAYLKSEQLLLFVLARRDINCHKGKIMFCDKVT